MHSVGMHGPGCLHCASNHSAPDLHLISQYLLFNIRGERGGKGELLTAVHCNLRRTHRVSRSSSAHVPWLVHLYELDVRDCGSMDD